MKVLLLQLPHPAFARRNLPLAAGYLKSYAYQVGLLEHANIEILDPTASDLSGCSRLLNEIVSREPDVVGFSIYVWNASRTLDLIGRIRRIRQRVKVIVGGPEVTPDSQYILSQPSIDYLVTGEGEAPFAEFLRGLLSGRSEFVGIPGLSWRSRGEWVHSTRQQRIQNLDEVPSPYLLGYIDPRRYREIMLFTMRGCRLACSYCSWASRGRLRAFSLERLRKELELAAATSRDMIVSVVDSALNTSPVFEEFCELARHINRDGRLKLNCFLQADLIEGRTVQLLKSAGVTGVEIGLQTSDPAVAKEIHRPVDTAAFLRGARLLEEGGLPYIVDVILGLPGDSASGFEKSMQFAAVNKLEPMIFNLSLGHGSMLRKRSSSFGAVLQAAPPFYVLETATFPRRDVESTLQRFASYSADRDSVINLNRPNFALRPPRRGEYAAAGGGASTSDPIRNVLIRVCGLKQVWAEEVVQTISANLGLNVSIDLQGSPEELERSVWLFEVLHMFCRDNPHCTWDIHLITGGHPPTLALVERIRTAMHSAPTFLDYRNELLARAGWVQRSRLNVFAHVSTNQVVSAEVLPHVTWIATLLVDGDLRAPPAAGPAGFLIDFAGDMDLIRRTMSLLRDSSTSAFFADWVLQRLWEREYLGITPHEQTHCEVQLDPLAGVVTRTFAEEELLWEAVVGWGLRRPEYRDCDVNFLIERLAKEYVSTEMVVGAEMES